MRGLDQIARNAFKRRIDGQKRERRVDVGEGKDNRKGAVEQKPEWVLTDVDVLQQGIKDAVAAENGLPCIGPYQITYPQRNDH